MKEKYIIVGFQTLLIGLGKNILTQMIIRVWINQDIDENFEEYITLNEFINNKPTCR